MNPLRALLVDQVKLYHEKARGRWRVAFYPLEGGPRRFVTLTATTQAEAELQRDRIRDAFKTDPGLRSNSARKPLTLGEWRDRFRELHPELSESSSHRNVAGAAGRLIAQLGEDFELAAVTPEHAQRYAARLSKMAPGTRANRIRHVKWWFSAAVKLGHVAENPFRHVRIPRVEAGEKAYVSLADMARLFQACQTQGERAMLALARWGGLRHGEAIRIRWDQIDLQRRVLTVTSQAEGEPAPEVTTKRRIRKAPLVPELAQVLEQLPRDRPPCHDAGGEWGSYQRVRAILKRAKLKIPRLMQSCRASRQTDWLREGHDVFKVSRWMGNSALVAAKHYDIERDADFVRVSGVTQRVPTGRRMAQGVRPSNGRKSSDLR